MDESLEEAYALVASLESNADALLKLLEGQTYEFASKVLDTAKGRLQRQAVVTPAAKL